MTTTQDQFIFAAGGWNDASRMQRLCYAGPWHLQGSIAELWTLSPAGSGHEVHGERISGVPTGNTLLQSCQCVCGSVETIIMIFVQMFRGRVLLSQIITWVHCYLVNHLYVDWWWFHEDESCSAGWSQRLLPFVMICFQLCLFVAFSFQQDYTNTPKRNFCVMLMTNNQVYSLLSEAEPSCLYSSYFVNRKL